MSVRDHVALLVGGVGGAKLALGLAKILQPGKLTVIVNTADDFEHLGLHVSPDVDTVMYTLAGIANPATGWGLDGDTFQAMKMVSRYGGPAWFRLGDQDLGTNLLRTTWLREGVPLTEVTHRLCAALGIEHPVLPMTDDRVGTCLETDQGVMGFQEYFVRERWQPIVRRIWFEGAEAARPTGAVVEALREATLIAFGPSNPMLSIDPILAVGNLREIIRGSRAPRVAVSPIIDGKAVKGPAAKLLNELSMEVSPVGITQHYKGLLDGIILDGKDAALRQEIETLGVRATARQTLMYTIEDKVNLAEGLLNWAEDL